ERSTVSTDHLESLAAFEPVIADCASAPETATAFCLQPVRGHEERAFALSPRPPALCGAPRRYAATAARRTTSAATTTTGTRSAETSVAMRNGRLMSGSHGACGANR